jgi:hypothetical protein
MGTMDSGASIRADPGAGKCDSMPAKLAISASPAPLRPAAPGQE